MSIPDPRFSQSPDSKSPLMFKIMAAMLALVGLIGVGLMVQQSGFTIAAILCGVAVVLLAGVCFSLPNLSQSQQSGMQLPDFVDSVNGSPSGSNIHQNPLFQPLALLSLSEKLLLLETKIDRQHLIQTKQTFEQCCAWQFNEPESFDSLVLGNDASRLTALEINCAKAEFKSEQDKQNIAKAWQQLLTQDSKQAVSCYYEVVDSKGNSVKIAETWLLTEGATPIWYRAIGLQNFTQVNGKSGTASQMMIEQNKMAALVRFADGIAHDYNNLFGIVNGYTELMTGVLDDPQKVNNYIEQIQSASTRAQALGDQILALSRRRKSGMELVDFEQAMIEPLFIFKKNLPDTVKFDWVLGKSHHQIKLDPSKLEEVLFALGENAITAMDAKGSLRIVSEVVNLPIDKAASLDLTAGDYLCFSVIDNGCGMDDEQLSQALEPYYSTTGGCGFGLASVYGFMKNCDGAIGIDSSFGQGTRVSLYFPLVN